MYGGTALGEAEHKKEVLIRWVEGFGVLCFQEIEWPRDMIPFSNLSIGID